MYSRVTKREKLLSLVTKEITSFIKKERDQSIAPLVGWNVCANVAFDPARDNGSVMGNVLRNLFSRGLYDKLLRIDVHMVFA